MGNNTVIVAGIDVTDHKEAAMDAKKNGVHMSLQSQSGPGGGNPMVRLVGPKEIVTKLLALWGHDLDAFQELSS